MTYLGCYNLTIMDILNGWSSLITRVQNSAWYTSLIIVLALFSLGVLLYEWLGESTLVQLETLLAIDLIIAYIFLADFVVGLFLNRSYASKSAYFKSNWLNLFSSIPVTTEVTQLLRILRIWRAVRVLRAAGNLWFARKNYTRLR